MWCFLYITGPTSDGSTSTAKMGERDTIRPTGFTGLCPESSEEISCKRAPRTHPTPWFQVHAGHWLNVAGGGHTLKGGIILNRV
jgi:hypothetical protein